VLSPDVIHTLPFTHYSRQQVADMLGISYHTVPNLARNGRVGADGDKYYLAPIKGKYPKHSVVDFLKGLTGYRLPLSNVL